MFFLWLSVSFLVLCWNKSLFAWFSVPIVNPRRLPVLDKHFKNEGHDASGAKRRRAKAAEVTETWDLRARCGSHFRAHSCEAGLGFLVTHDGTTIDLLGVAPKSVEGRWTEPRSCGQIREHIQEPIKRLLQSQKTGLVDTFGSVSPGPSQS